MVYNIYNIYIYIYFIPGTHLQTLGYNVKLSNSRQGLPYHTGGKTTHPLGRTPKLIILTNGESKRRATRLRKYPDEIFLLI